MPKPLLGFFAVQFKVSNRKLFQGSKTDLHNLMQTAYTGTAEEEDTRSLKYTAALFVPKSLVPSSL